MARKITSIIDEANSRSLRNSFCRLTTPSSMAETSCHLRNFAVAEVIGLVGMLDGHPQIKGRPTIKREGASIQQRSGTVDNPFAHVAPSNLLLNGRNIASFFTIPAAKTMIARVFSMGVMAPDDWSDLNTFSINPAQQNITDNIGENFKTEGGLVAAFEKTISNAAGAGVWNGSGKSPHTSVTLEKFVFEHYRQSWQSLAGSAYERALMYLTNRLSVATKVQNQRAEEKARQRIAIVKAQKDLLKKGSVEVQEAARNVWAAVSQERWK